jgi:hypothetical protein
MPIKPIDLQTNIGQMTEVGKAEHARHAGILQQQNVLDKEAAEKSNLVKDRLDELKKGEQTQIKNEEKGSPKERPKGKLVRKRKRKKINLSQ